MKILYLHPNSWTGEYSILVQFVKMGHEVYVLEQDKRLPDFRCVLHDFFREKNDGIRTLWYNAHREWRKALTMPLDLVTRDRFNGRNLVHIMAIIRHSLGVFKDADVVVCSDGYSYAVPACVLKKLGLFDRPLVVSFIGGDILDFPELNVGQRRTRFTETMFKVVYSQADILRPVSPLLRDIIAADGGSHAKIRICPSHMGTDNVFRSISEVKQLRRGCRERMGRRLAISNDARICAAVSGGGYHKGMHLIPEALQAIRGLLPDLQVIFVGPVNDYMAGVKEKCWKLGLRDNVHFVGRLLPEEVLECLAAVDVNLNPSLGEGLNMVVAEAASVGTPSITSDAAGICHWVTTYNAGMVVKANDSDALGLGLTDFFSKTHEDRRSCQENALKMSREFHLDKIATKLLDIFCEVI